MYPDRILFLDSDRRRDGADFHKFLIGVDFNSLEQLIEIFARYLGLVRVFVRLWAFYRNLVVDRARLVDLLRPLENGGGKLW